MENCTQELETIEGSCRAVHEVMGRHYFIGNIQFRNRWVSLVIDYKGFIIRIETKLRDLGWDK